MSSLDIDVLSRNQLAVVLDFIDNPILTTPETIGILIVSPRMG